MRNANGVRTHLATTPDPIALHEPDPNKRSGFMKPPGFWYEVDGDWRRWKEQEGYGGRGTYHLHAVDLRSCNVRVVRTKRELIALDSELPKRDHHGLPDRFGHPDWTEVMERWDGLEIAPWMWDFELDLMWYYAWDCASGVIWRPRDATVTYLGPVELGEDA